MRILYIVIGVVFLLVLLGILFGICRTRWAIRKVRGHTDQEKIARLDETILPFGYCYDEKWDVFTTILHPWQRDMGYCRLYDESAISMSMVIDCEPIEFEYAGTLYLIEFWKGQYGMTTGMEVGIYKAEKPADYRRGDFIFYKSVPDDEMLPMSMILYKDGKIIMQRSARNWWLTGFELGEFSSPGELAADIRIDFPNCGMRNAFLQELLRIGYQESDLRVRGTSVRIWFDTPKTTQPVRRWRLLRHLVMRRNRQRCRKYLRLTSHFDRTLDRVDFLCTRYKMLAHFALRFSKITEGTMRRVRRRESRRGRSGKRKEGV